MLRFLTYGHHEKINICCFKLLNWGKFVMQHKINNTQPYGQSKSHGWAWGRELSSAHSERIAKL